MHRLVAALLVPLAAAGCAAVGDGDGEPAGLGQGHQAIVNGELAGAEPEVVALVYDGSEFCSATLVSPRVVVTAAHCLPPNLDVPVDQLGVFFGSSTQAGGTTIGVAEAVVHPAWNPDVVPNDIGLIALAEDAPVAPARMIGSFTRGSGEAVRLVGFGITVADGHDNGVKREGMATIEHVDASTIFLDAGPSLTCNGDSGGPLFVGDGAGGWLFAGIHSRSDCATVSLGERVDVHRADRIEPFIAEHEGGVCDADQICDEDCTHDPDCVGGPAGPAAADDLVGGCAAGGSGGGMCGALLALALAVISRRRRAR
jgi:uncharacterized protein (TIGR03382 family)